MRIGAFLEERLRRFRPPFIPWVFKAHLVAVVALAFLVPLFFVALPYLEWFNDMAVQPKGKTQGHFGWFEGERRAVERPPPEGVLPMGYEPYPYPGGSEAAEKEAGAKLKNPFRPTRALLEKGRHLFEHFCIVCHGKQGEGDGPIVGPSLFPAPPSLHTKEARALPDGRIFHVITRGRNAMPPYGDVFDEQERWAIVLYVRVLQRAMNPEPGDLEK